MKRLLQQSLVRRTTEAVIVAAILAGFPAAVSSGQSSAAESFADEFVAAVNSRNAERRIELIHPLTRACINPSTQPYFDWIFTRQSRLAIGTYKVTATPISRTAILPTDGHSDYPTRPTHQLQINFSSPSKTSSVVVFVVRDGGRWREVLPCPRGDVSAQAEANKKAQEQMARRVADLTTRMSPNLRQELLALLREGRTLEAIKRYAAVSGQDINTSKGVVESLQP
jgi:hypothetical protein